MHRRINAPRIRRLAGKADKRLVIKTLQRITCVERFYFDSRIGSFLVRRIFIALFFVFILVVKVTSSAALLRPPRSQLAILVGQVPAQLQVCSLRDAQPVRDLAPPSQFSADRQGWPNLRHKLSPK